MGEVFWVERQAGDKSAIISDPQEMDGGFAVMLAPGGAIPDRVMLPDEIGGGQVIVLEAFEGHCPHPEGSEACGVLRHLKLDQPGLYVAECPEHKFVWYQRTSEVVGEVPDPPNQE